MPLATHIPRQTTLSFGNILISGYNTGTRITIDQTDDDFSEVAGIDLVSRSLISNGLYTVVFVLQQTSIVNDQLSVLRNIDTNLVSPGLGVQQCTFKDLRGTTKLFSPNAYLKKPATGTFGTDIESREWTIVCVDTEYFVGGNPINL